MLGANAGLDLSFEVPGLRLGRYHHPHQVRITAGGAKGVNVARALRQLRQAVRVTGFAGGHVGQQLMRLLDTEGVASAFVPIANESRLCLNLVDPKTGHQTQVDQSGPEVTPSEIAALRDVWSSLMADSRLAIISGSPPPSVPASLYGELVAVARQASVPVFVDVRDEYLTASLRERPDLLRINREEFCCHIGHDLRSWYTIARSAQSVIDMGVGALVISWGRRGALAVTSQGVWQAEPPPVEVVSAVGSGDAMLAGLAHAFLLDLEWPERLVLGVAAGTANATVLETCSISGKEMLRLQKQVRFLPLEDM